MELSTSQLPIEQLRQIRIDKLNRLRELGIDPYPAVSNRTNVIGDVTNSFDDFDSKEVTLSGRVVSSRHHGKLIFIDIKDQSGKIQVYLKESDLKNNPNRENSELAFSEVVDLIDLSDFIEVTGLVTKTPRGEISIEPSNFRILTKSIRGIPQELKDKEIRYRKRYLDTNIHQDVFDRFIRRSKFWKAHRDFFAKKGFIEMNIPILESVIGGGDATPFVTHMNAIDEDFYLRISQELPLKRLIGAGYEKVFEIGPRFRNEGLSDEHLPEHMAMEFYWAYADWEDGMKFIQDLINYVIDEVYPGKTSFDIRGFKDIQFGNEWEIIDFKKVFKDKFGIEDVYTITQEEVEAKVKEHIKDVDFQVNIPRGVDNLWKLIRKEVKGPAFLINHPKYLSPLQKPDKENPLMVNRFQPIIAGSELGNGWSEITDALDQFERFSDQEKLRKSGDKEAQMMDIDYVEMLEYGMPPTFGWGHSERLFWFLEDISAREGVIFPAMKHSISDETKKVYKIQEKVVPVNVSNTDLKFMITSTMNKPQALELLHKNMQNKNLRRHCYAVGYAMEGIKKGLPSKEGLPPKEAWQVLGIIHDADYELTKEDWTKHTILLLDWLKGLGMLEDDPIYLAIKSHNNKITKLRDPQTDMEWALECCDELTGFIVACALVKGGKLNEVTLETVKKKWPQKAFAKGVKREQIEQCDEKLGINLDEFINIVLKSMQEHSEELGL